MRNKIVAGNWKMNLSLDEGQTLMHQIVSTEGVLTYIFPSLIYIKTLIDSKNNDLIIGAQNGYFEDKGAFTGEVSIQQLKQLGVKAVLIGHSERRQHFNEDNEVLKLKINAALHHEIQPFFCCGESLEQRENGSFKSTVIQQLHNSLFHLSSEEIKRVVIAYEPIWAIGTGKTASAKEAEDMHSAIRKALSEKYGQAISEEISLLYGGSCNPLNAKELFSQPNIDGGLIGGASLKAEDFNILIQSF